MSKNGNNGNNGNFNQLEDIGKWINKNLIANPVLFLGILGLVFFLTLNMMQIFPSLTIRKSESIDIAGIFWGTATILAIVERSIEMFIAAWRNPGKNQLEQKIAIEKEKTFQSLPQEQKDRINAKKEEIKMVGEEIMNKLSDRETNKIALETKNNELEDQQQKVDALPDEDPSKQEEKANLDSIQAVVDSLNTNNQRLDEQIKGLEIKLQTLNNEHLALLLGNSISSKLDDQIKELAEYEVITAQYALYLGIGFGLMASIAGIRILEPLVDLSGLEDAQLNTFQKFDLVVSALGISGGTKLFHGLPALISDTLQSTRDMVNNR